MYYLTFCTSQNPDQTEHGSEMAKKTIPTSAVWFVR
jgi:hypothetical protein